MSDVPVLLFDGVCNFCNATIQFIVDHERSSEMRFLSLQSDLAKPLLERAFGVERANELRGQSPSKSLDSVVLIEGSRGYTHSAAGLRIVRFLRAPYRWLYAFVVVPRPIRDVIYRWIARNRYRWFGRTETCRVPTADLRARFLG